MNATHDVAAVLLEITNSLKPDDPRELLLDRVAASVVKILPDADAASVTLYNTEVPATVAATDIAQAQGIRTSLSCPLFVPQADQAACRRARELGLAGALNVWSRHDDAFDPLEAALIAMFTSAAAAVVLTAERWSRAENQARSLVTALKTRDTIATAKGIVMAQLDLSKDAAFQWLTEVSQHTNRKVRDVAKLIVADPEVVTLLSR